MNQYFINIPEKVENDLENIDEYFKTLSIAGYNIDNLREIISIISTQIKRKDNTAQLQMKYINKLVPSGQLYIKGLIDYGVIKRSGSYIPGERSYNYSFTKKYGSKYISYLLTNNKLKYRIERVQEEFRKNGTRSVRGRSEQVKYLRHLTMDPGYQNLLVSDSTLSVEQHNNILASATRIINGDIFYIVDDTSGRFHSNVTNMAKSIRKYLRVDGKPLLNLDIKNSQPYLSILLLTDPGKVSWLTKDPDFAATLENLKVSKSKDVMKYIKLVVEGGLYENLMERFASEGLILTRDQTKSQVLRILFARNRTPKDETNKKARQIFIKNFPTVHKIFSRIRGRANGDKFQNFKRFAILLQTIEAHLMLDVIVKRICKEHPGTVVMTIHDSIMTTTSTDNVEAVRKIMIDEFTKYVGYPPRISVEI